jgi:hypothetical protein
MLDPTSRGFDFHDKNSPRNYGFRNDPVIDGSSESLCLGTATEGLTHNNFHCRPPTTFILYYFQSDTMKITKSLFVVFLSVLALTVAQDGAEETEPVEQAIEINCDEICTSQVAEATRVCNEQMAGLKDQLSPLKAALEQAKDSSVVAASEVATLKSQLVSMEGVVAAAKADAEAITASAAEKEAIINAKLAEMVDQVTAANARVTEYENMLFFINKQKVTSDLFALFRKLGVLKAKEPETDL